MVDGLRDLAEHPLDRRVARGILILGLAATVGAGLLVGLASIGAGGRTGAAMAGVADGRGQPRVEVPATIASKSAAAPPWQDPQDRRGSAARRRATAELRSHRALQHVPYRHAGVSVVLAGARGPRAVLRVGGPTVAAARAGWRAFLGRFDDRGSAYVPRFRGGRQHG
jgi:hypothetical protein